MNIKDYVTTITLKNTIFAPCIRLYINVSTHIQTRFICTNLIKKMINKTQCIASRDFYACMYVRYVYSIPLCLRVDVGNIKSYIEHWFRKMPDLKVPKRVQHEDTLLNC